MSLFSRIWGHLSARFYAGTSAAAPENAPEYPHVLDATSWPIESPHQPVPGPEPTIRHLPDDGVIPPGWRRLEGAFQKDGRSYDGMVKEDGRPICIDVLHPGESINLGITFGKNTTNERTTHPNPAGSPNSNTKEPL
jgi:hypothetical protein